MKKREVPQFINIEDKIAFQLTAKQLGWVGLGGALIFLAWLLLEQFYFIVIAVVISLLIVAILFVRPYGMSLPDFIKNLFLYFFRSRMYIWKRSEQQSFAKKYKPKKAGEEKESSSANRKKGKDMKKIKKAAQALDIFEK